MSPCSPHFPHTQIYQTPLICQSISITGNLVLHSGKPFFFPFYYEGNLVNTSLMDRINNMVSENPVVIFSKSSCCMSHTIRTLFCEFGVNPMVYELDEIAKGREIEEALSRLGRNATVPVVFIGGEFVGGANEVMSLHINRSLKPKLINAGALWV